MVNFWVLVGVNSKDIIAFQSFSEFDHKVLASPDVVGVGTAVYRQGDIFKIVQSEAGAHVVAGGSLGSGFTKITGGHKNVTANNIPVACHNSPCLINCNASGMGGASGKLLTTEKSIGSGKMTCVPTNPGAPPGERTSERLERLKAARDKLKSGQLDLDALDEYVDFKSANAGLDELIGEIKGPAGTATDYAAQFGRRVLGLGKDIVTGVGELAYEGIKAVPKLARRAERARPAPGHGQPIGEKPKQPSF